MYHEKGRVRLKPDNDLIRLRQRKKERKKKVLEQYFRNQKQKDSKKRKRRDFNQNTSSYLNQITLFVSPRRSQRMDSKKLSELKLFVEQCKSDPSLLSTPSLSFFRDYLQRWEPTFLCFRSNLSALVLYNLLWLRDSESFDLYVSLLVQSVSLFVSYIESFDLCDYIYLLYTDLSWDWKTLFSIVEGRSCL